MENVFAYKVYIGHDDNTAYFYARYAVEENVTTTFTSLDGLFLTQTSMGAVRIAVGTVDMTGVTERTIRLKKSDTVIVDGQVFTPSAVVYKITIVKKAVYRVELAELDKIYDGVPVKPNILRLYSEDTGVEYVPTTEELSSAVYTFYQAQGTTWTNPGTDMPKNAGVYKISVRIDAVTYTAVDELAFVIGKRPLTVNRIQNALAYVSFEDNMTWTAPCPIRNPGTIYLTGIVDLDDVSASAENVFFNDVALGYGTDKITLIGIILSGVDAKNYETADTQTVFGQINYSLDGAFFRRKPGFSWEKFYPVDSTEPVNDKTADYHSPANDGVYDTHGEYIREDRESG